MLAGKLLACDHNGPLRRNDPRGLVRFGGAQLLDDRYHNLPFLQLGRLMLCWLPSELE